MISWNKKSPKGFKTPWGIVLIFCLLLIAGLAGQAQHTYFYNAKGQFYLDTTLTISKAQLSFWRFAETNLATAFSRIEYPPFYLENGIKTKSPIIVSFVLDTSDITEVKILNDSSIFATAIKSGMKQQGKDLVAQFRRSWSSSDTTYVGKYYIAFDFGLVDFSEYLKTQKAIPIIRQTSPMIDFGHGCPTMKENPDIKK
jgi:hypothetical protein